MQDVLLTTTAHIALDSCRVETQNRLRTYQVLSLVGYEPNHDELRYERKRQVSTPSRKKCGHLRKRASRPRRVRGKPTRRRQDRRSSTPQGKDSIDKTTRTVIDTVDEADDKGLTSLNQWNGCKKRHTLLVMYRRKTTVLQPSIENPQPDCIWMQGEELYPRFNNCSKGT